MESNGVVINQTGGRMIGTSRVMTGTNHMMTGTNYLFTCFLPHEAAGNGRDKSAFRQKEWANGLSKRAIKEQSWHDWAGSWVHDLKCLL